MNNHVVVLLWIVDGILGETWVRGVVEQSQQWRGSCAEPGLCRDMFVNFGKY